MTDLAIAAPLAAAIEARGYATLTPVQLSMLAPETAGRDALVSAQTGSGKTVAFGLAIAPELLAGADRLLFADLPVALVVAPTRELALQVRREFEWLYAEAGAQIASCVGGMDYRTEKRALERGAHIVVGTPGRLRDHIERGSLDLSGLRAVVLDEADEMLDLGFREDLEFILSAAPAERRTLMFSATVPKEIADLAQSFQTDALRIVAQGEAKQHVDIEYRALSVSARDKEHAIFNLLRFYEARTAIVFCKTRVNVNHLLARMGNRGFQVVALSGELSQQERTHALQALRDGRARVCIATDVAARGIDLPGLELVIHADLPSNSEVLLHRSGRTGRAGSKGVSALIVAPAEFRKAQRLLQGAKVVAEWGSAPSAEEVQEKDDLRLLDHPTLQTAPGEDAAMAAALLERFGADTVAAAFVRLWREGRSAPEVLHEAAGSGATPAPARPRGEFGEAVWYELSVGRSGRAEARWLLPKICDAGGIAKDAIGAIRVQEDRTFVQIAKAAEGRFGANAELEAGLTMTRLAGEPTLDSPERAPRKPYVRRDDAEARPAAARPAAPRPAASRSSESRPDEARPDYAPRAKPAYRGKDSFAAPAAETVEAVTPARKPYVKRDDAPARKPYAPREDAPARKTYAARDDAPARKPYAPREDAPARKPYAKAADGAAPRKTYAKRDDAERKPYAPRAEAKPYAPRSAEAKPYARRDAAPAAAAGEDRKPRWKAETGKSAGFKSHGGSSDKPARASGFKSHAAEGKPAYAKPAYAKPAYDKAGPGAKPAGKSAGFKSQAAGADGSGARKTFGKPAAAPLDARDTSKRFVPPRKPKS